jgi:trk system potassium uptake protein
MNYQYIAKLLGHLLLFLCLALAFCLGFAVWDGEGGQPGLDAVEGFATAVGVTLITAVTLISFGWRERGDLLRRESVTVVGLGWVICTTFGALPFLLCEPRMDLASGLFESVSGFTTTGATVIGDLETVPRSLLLWRSLSQWLGGMGILVLFVALLSSFGTSSKALFRHESSTRETEGLPPRIQRIALQLWTIYLVFSALAFLGLVVQGMGKFDALCHAFAAISTGGFGTHNESVAYFDNVGIELWLTLVMMLGSINFVLYGWLIRRQWDRWKQDEASKTFLIIVAVSSLAIAVDLVHFGNVTSYWQGFRQGLFQVVSIMSTTGFTTTDFDQWPALSDVILLLLMLIGGCAGSTSGGIKVGRWILFFKVFRQQLLLVFRPNLITKLSLNGNPVTDSFRIDTLFLISVAGVSVAVGTLVVSLLQPELDIDSAMTATLASLFNIGPGLGAVGPSHTYGFLHAPTKLFLAFLMLLGRLEFYALLVLFVPSLWKKY